jgi:glutamate synthase (NADPH/NADH) large chain
LIRPGPTGLYDPRHEHDSCGFGLIANLDHQPSRWIVDTAIEALSRLTHRGAIAADGKTGDGCGLLLASPEAFLRAQAAACGYTLAQSFASGIVFLPIDEAAAARCRAELETQLSALKIKVPGWRIVPVDTAALGEQALRTLPRIEQIFVSADASHDASSFQRALFLARRRAEQALAGEPEFYVASLSPKTINYKAMVMPEFLPQFYKDLANPALKTSVALFHQRFSTNTQPMWKLAQPFRALAHNGEINTIEGNRNWARARAKKWRSGLIEFSEFDPLVSMQGSDSQSLDEMLEILLIGGMDLLQAARILIPPAWQGRDAMDPDLKAFYEYHAMHLEPWDGPAGIVMYDGRYAGCTLDRNGLRPARYVLTEDRHLIVASEVGVIDVDPARIRQKGRLGPGQMLAVDLYSGELLDSARIDGINKSRQPYARWVRQGIQFLESSLIDPSLAAEPFDDATLARFQKLFNLSAEERDVIVRTLAVEENEATGSMGDDAPLAPLSARVRSLYDYFRQAFAQVTNPPIDPIREQLVMSLGTQIGRECNIFENTPDNARQILMSSPILSQRKLRQLLAQGDSVLSHRVLDLYYPDAEGLPAAIDRLCAEAAQAVRDGVVILLISDRYPKPGTLPVHALLAVGAIHLHLVAEGLRCDCNLIIETGTARDPHHFACLIGYGATAVYPFLAYQTLYDLRRRGRIPDAPNQLELGRSYRRGIRKGLYKILSKMGISTIASYRGAQLFEAVGLASEVVRRCFSHTPSRVEGAGFADIEADQRWLRERAEDPQLKIETGGLLKFVHGGEYHMYNPDVVQALQQAVKSEDPADYARYASLVNERPPSTLRDLLTLRLDRAPVPIDEVEPWTEIVKRFDSAAMSLGALSPEAHEALAIAMNRLGARSNSGEGGEDPLRYGTEKRSKIKQVASARFGVTPAYLISAEVLQIKVAQGAKPGEGGQLPGHKVTDLIARLRYAKPGIGLISPPPHHDIYSIEDLAQLIYDLKQVNPDALVSVKLVSHAGVGTIAAGVAKCNADLITIAGHDGGTGASPLSSVKYAGGPFELGLAEAHQTLKLNDLRSRVRLQADGGMKTGLDVIKAALLGAESFGFGTAPMIALGCKYLRICHLNNCATGVATQHPTLREKHFHGEPERVIAYFRFVAEEVRQYMAALGVRRFDELVGQTGWLEVRKDVDAHHAALDLSKLLSDVGLADRGNCCMVGRNAPYEPGQLGERLSAAAEPLIAGGTGGELVDAISNRDRAIGARLSGRIAKQYGDQGMADRPITVRLTGSAGQSFGAFNAGGLNLVLTGEANDYVGKGMAGGRLVIKPPRGAGFPVQGTPILGNTCLYGATGGELYAAGAAGERFAVRNSGALAVVEGAGDHCCEYMTGGIVLVLGKVGYNFGAGMTGGFAYVLDVERDFVDRYNHELIDIHRISAEGMQSYYQHLRRLLQTHVAETGSATAREIAEDLRGYLPKFWLVKPKAASLGSLINTLKRAA